MAIARETTLKTAQNRGRRRSEICKLAQKAVYQFFYQFDAKKRWFLQLRKNVARSEKTQKTKKDEELAITPRLRSFLKKTRDYF